MGLRRLWRQFFRRDGRLGLILWRFCGLSKSEGYQETGEWDLSEKSFTAKDAKHAKVRKKGFTTELILSERGEAASAWTASLTCFVSEVRSYFDGRVSLPNDRNRRSLDSPPYRRRPVDGARFARDDKLRLLYAANLRFRTLRPYRHIEPMSTEERHLK